MKKNFFLHSLPFRLLVGVAFGICIGLLLNIIDESAITTAVLNVVVTSKYILGQLISFSVPLIIIGFIAPSITRLGNNASRMLGVAVSIAYASSLGAALFSALSGYLLIPHLSFSSTASHLKALPDVVFELSIPQIMPVMSALVLAIMLGLASAWTKASLISSFLEEFQKIILAIVSRVIIPILPYFIGLTFCSLAYEGTITRQLPVFLQVIVIVLIGHFIWSSSIYTCRNLFQRKSSESCKTLWSRLPHSHRYHVICCHIAGRPPMCTQSKTSAKRSGKFWYSTVCQHSSLRFCPHRSILLYDNLQNSLWCSSCAGGHGSFLCPAWNFCHWCSGCTGRHCYGISRYYHRYPEIRRFCYSSDADYLCPSGQFRNSL